MQRMTYKQAFDKITEAYIKDEIKPMDPRFCFCGTLSPDESWKCQFDSAIQYPYNISEYKQMEWALFFTKSKLFDNYWSCLTKEEFEEAIFQGMCAALDVLKQIHINRGENIDDVPVFTKRQLSIV